MKSFKLAVATSLLLIFLTSAETMKTPENHCRIAFYQGGKDTIRCFPEFETREAMNSYHIDIYNRWGNKMFESENFNERWICTDSCNKDIASGTYAYVVRYSLVTKPQEEDTFMSTFYVIR